MKREVRDSTPAASALLRLVNTHLDEQCSEGEDPRPSPATTYRFPARLASRYCAIDRPGCRCSRSSHHLVESEDGLTGRLGSLQGRLFEAFPAGGPERFGAHVAPRPVPFFDQVAAD